MAYVAQKRLDGYAEMVAHVIKRKAAFDKRVLAHKPGEVSFLKNQLVQIDLDYTFTTDRKLLPKWSPPQRVAERNFNSYTLKRLDGTPITGQFSTRRLRGFIPKEGTTLAQEQAKIEQQRIEGPEIDAEEAGDTLPATSQHEEDKEVDDDSDEWQGFLSDKDATTRGGGHME
jgi:hypothetical protein